jgi:hypothetical protein
MRAAQVCLFAPRHPDVGPSLSCMIAVGTRPPSVSGIRSYFAADDCAGVLHLYSINGCFEAQHSKMGSFYSQKRTSLDAVVLCFQLTPNFPRWTSSPLDVKHLSYCDVKPFRHMRENGKVWIPKHSITTICLPISPAEHPTL